MNIMTIEEKPLITIITLSYKKYDYIYEAIKSVLIQDYPNIQYIISDDGSPDCPCKEIQTYVNQHSRDNIKEFLLLTRKKNVGTVKNINEAVARSKGEYIINLSADDVFYTFDVVSRIVESFHKRQCDVLGTLRLRCNESLKPIRYMPSRFYQCRIMKWDTAKQQYEAFVSGRSFEMASGSVLSYKKSYLEKHLFDESYMLWEDGPFIERYLREGNFLHLDYSFTAIYYREGGISTGQTVNPLLKRDTQLYLKTLYDNHRYLVGRISRKLLESFLVAAFEERNVISWIRRNVKYFYLTPIKLYYLIEKKLVYNLEKLLIRYGRIKV